jgi:ubiquinone/menaquinone biosynthesis C-methylase UbiE
MTEHHGHQHASDDAAHGPASRDAALAELLDLDAAVLHSYWTDALSWATSAATGTVSRILDLGAGSGTAAIALAQQFDEAEVIAIDVSAEMLRRIRSKARELGLRDRVRTALADLDVGWPEIDLVDLTWASMSLHHLTDVPRVLADLYAATRPGGLVAVAEFAEPIRFLPHEVGLGRAGLEERFLDAVHTERAHSGPTLSADWSSPLATAGFTVFGERTFTIEITAPFPPGTAQYALSWLRRMRSGLADRLAPEDLETLTALIDGGGLESVVLRGDLRPRGSRTVTLARRPSAAVSSPMFACPTQAC